MKKKQEECEDNYLIIGMMSGLLIGLIVGLMIYGIIILDYNERMDSICQKAGFEEYDGFNYINKTIICKGEIEKAKELRFNKNGRMEYEDKLQ
jgi:hypothetical protein